MLFSNHHATKGKKRDFDLKPHLDVCAWSRRIFTSVSYVCMSVCSHGMYTYISYLLLCVNHPYVSYELTSTVLYDVLGTQYCTNTVVVSQIFSVIYSTTSVPYSYTRTPYTVPRSYFWTYEWSMRPCVHAAWWMMRDEEMKRWRYEDQLASSEGELVCRACLLCRVSLYYCLGKLPELPTIQYKIPPVPWLVSHRRQTQR